MLKTSCFYRYKDSNAWFENIFGWLMMVWSDKKKIWSAREEMQSRTKGSKFIALIPDGISTISWATMIILRWFLNHFEAKRCIYIWYETSKSNSAVFIVQKLKYRNSTQLRNVIGELNDQTEVSFGICWYFS